MGAASTRKWILIAALVGLATIGALWRWIQNAGPVPVEAAEAKRSVISASFSANGAVSGRAAEIGFEISGRVAEIAVQEGDEVRKGQVLIKLEDQAAIAAVQEAEANLSAAKVTLSHAEVALRLARQQASAREAQARANLAAAVAQLRQLLSGPRPEEIARAEQQVKLAQTDLLTAEKAFRRAQELFAQGAISQAQLDEASARFESSRAQYQMALEALKLIRTGPRPEELAAAQARVDAARGELEAVKAVWEEVRLRELEVHAATERLHQAAAALEAAKAQAAKTVLRAPFRGVISRVTVELGESVMPGVPVVTLVDPAELWVSADLPNEDAAKVRVGQEVSVTIPAYPGRRFKGKVIELGPQAEVKTDAALRTRVVRMKVGLLEGRELLRPGLAADIEGTGVVAPSALVVPSDALLTRGDRNVVFVVQDGKAVLREVRTGYSTFAVTEILEGLQEGELVVVRGKEGLSEGRRVRVIAIRRSNEF